MIKSTDYPPLIPYANGSLPSVVIGKSNIFGVNKLEAIQLATKVLGCNRPQPKSGIVRLLAQVKIVESSNKNPKFYQLGASLLSPFELPIACEDGTACGPSP
jgi:hypothetical protein